LQFFIYLCWCVCSSFKILIFNIFMLMFVIYHIRYLCWCICSLLYLSFVQLLKAIANNGFRKGSHQHCCDWSRRLRQVDDHRPSYLQVRWYWQENDREVWEGSAGGMNVIQLCCEILKVPLVCGFLEWDILLSCSLVVFE